MHDRQPKYPGRIELTDVLTGEKRKYDMKMADEATIEGDPPVTRNLLKQKTAAIFGLGTSAVPDDVFASLGGLSNYYVWKKTIVAKQPGAVLGPEKTNLLISQGTSTDSDQEVYIRYSKPDFPVDNDGNLQAFPNRIDATAASAPEDELQDALPGAYVMGTVLGVNNPQTRTGMQEGSYYYFPTGTTFTGGWDGGTRKVCASKYQEVTSFYGATESVEFVFSTDRGQYPDSGSQGGAEYEYMGQLGDKTRMVVGSYAGSGEYGSGNPNTIALPFPPKFVLISDGSSRIAIWVYNSDSMYPYGSSATGTDEGLEWYSGTSADHQLNELNSPYVYVAFG